MQRRNLEKGTIVKNIANSFWVKNNQGVFLCSPRGNLKSEGLYVGDVVDFSSNDEQYTIERLHQRLNLLKRPPIANLEVMAIVVAPKPKPDFLIVDKLLLFAKISGITPIIVVNKYDLEDFDCAKYVEKCYSNFVKTLCVSTVNGYNMIELKSLLQGKITVFAGQSAVGKSSIVSWFMPNVSVEIGDFSKRIERGKNTTRHTELFEFAKDSFIADTPGFSFLDETALPIKYSDLFLYYDDFLALKEKCKFSTCEHCGEDENVCAVKKAVKSGLIDAKRYDRYCQIRESLQKRWKNEHK